MPKKTEPKPRSEPGGQASDEDRASLDMTPVGREFGSTDYERLIALDHAAFIAFQSWEQVRHWLAAPNPQLGGACPEDAARNAEGFEKVMSILMAGDRVSDGFMREGEALPIQEGDSPQGVKSLKGMFGHPSKRRSIEDMNAAIARRGAGKK